MPIQGTKHVAVPGMADHGQYKIIAYVLAILCHTWNIHVIAVYSSPYLEFSNTFAHIAYTVCTGKGVQSHVTHPVEQHTLDINHRSRVHLCNLCC
jgi:hypothetical protein